MRTPAQRRNLLILRDEILPGIAEGALDMRHLSSCLIGHARASRKLWYLESSYELFGIDNSQWRHIFSLCLPNDPSWLAANITDLLEADI